MILEIHCCQCRKKKIREEVELGYKVVPILEKYKWKGVKAGYMCSDCIASSKG